MSEPVIVLGIDQHGRKLQYPLSRLRERHFAVAGPTGQRKTMLTLSLILQFLLLLRDVCVFVDLGGDQAATWLLAEAAEAAGKPFYFFSLDNHHDTCCWDPIAGTPAYAYDTTIAASGIASGLSLLHGDGFGRSFFGRLNQREIDSAFDNLATKHSRLPTFSELVRELCRLGEATRNAKHVSEAFLAAERLLRYDALTGCRPKRLDLGRAIEESAVIVFHLPTALREEASRAVASMLIRAVMAEAAHRSEQGLDKRHVHLVVDEYPQVATSRGAVDSALVLARKWNVAIWAVYQDDAQLITPEGDLRSIIRSQCQRILFARESKDEIEELRNRSLDVLRPETSHGLRGLSASTSQREVLEPGLTRNEIIQVSGTAMQAYADLRLGDKHRDPIPFTIIPPTRSVAHHEELKSKPLPRWNPPEASPEPAPRAGEPQRPAELTESAAKRHSALARLADKIDHEAVWELP